MTLGSVWWVELSDNDMVSIETAMKRFFNLL